MELCKVENCDRPQHARGWCSMHWGRWNRHGDPLGGRATVPIQISDQFGQLTVLEQATSRPYGGHRWLCKCTCGNETIVDAQPLRQGKTQSCGCLATELKRSRIVHGYSRDQKRHPLYMTWVNMRQRCNNPKHHQYADYGGRGIKVDPRWDHFVEFLQDMGDRPTRYHSLERIDNGASYGPTNCCWATRDEQYGNRRGLGVVGMKKLDDYLDDCISFIETYAPSLTPAMMDRMEELTNASNAT